MESRIRGLLAVALLAVSIAADAGVILQDNENSAIQVEAFEPVAQSFTAEDATVSFAFFYRVFNPPFPNDPLQLRLLAGDGLAGAQLGSFSFSVPDGFEGYFDVDLSSIALSVGQLYTAELSVPGTSPYWGVALDDGGNPYSGGRAYFSDLPFDPHPDASDDFRFRVTPTTGAVPEPGTLALLGIGLAAFGFGRRKTAA